MRSFKDSFVHNPIGWYNDENADGWEDKKELFLLKTAEECYREDFLRIIVPHNQSRVIDQAAAARVERYLDNMITGASGGHLCGDTSLVTGGGVTALNMSPTRRTAIALASAVKSKGSAIVVAHSQGNLLAHLAYARLARELGDDANRVMRIVNVANTSVLAAHGLDMTHGNDRALALLLALGQRYKRTTPRCNDERCNFVITSATLAGTSVDGVDADNHDFITTYLSGAHVDVLNPQGISFTDGRTEFRDRFVDFVYAAAASLDAFNPVTMVATARVFRIDDESALLRRVLANPVRLGDVVTFNVTYPLNIPDALPDDPTVGAYYGFAGGNTRVTLKVGSNPIIERPVTASSSTIFVTRLGNSGVGDPLGGFRGFYKFEGNETCVTVCVHSIQMQLVEKRLGTLVTSDSLPRKVPTLESLGEAPSDRLVLLWVSLPGNPRIDSLVWAKIESLRAR